MAKSIFLPFLPEIPQVGQKVRVSVSKEEKTIITEGVVTQRMRNHDIYYINLHSPFFHPIIFNSSVGKWFGHEDDGVLIDLSVCTID